MSPSPSPHAARAGLQLSGPTGPDLCWEHVGWGGCGSSPSRSHGRTSQRRDSGRCRHVSEERLFPAGVGAPASMCRGTQCAFVKGKHCTFMQTRRSRGLRRMETRRDLNEQKKLQPRGPAAGAGWGAPCPPWLGGLPPGGRPFCRTSSDPLYWDQDPGRGQGPTGKGQARCPQQSRGAEPLGALKGCIWVAATPGAHPLSLCLPGPQLDTKEGRWVRWTQVTAPPELLGRVAGLGVRWRQPCPLGSGSYPLCALVSRL